MAGSLNMLAIKSKRKAIELAPIKDGFIRRAISRRKKKSGFIITYNVDKAEHTVYQQEGFTHYISGKKITKNKGFIDNTVAGIIMLAILEFGGTKKQGKQAIRKFGFRTHKNGNKVLSK